MVGPWCGDRAAGGGAAPVAPAEEAWEVLDAPGAVVNSVIALSRAADFAARKHTDQRRKGVRAEPYLNHLLEVGLLLADATGGSDPELVMAGLLHDTLEDTVTSREEIATMFGLDVAGLVAEVTDDRSLPSAERKRLQVLHAPMRSTRARMIKIADKISNLRGLIESPPANWSAERQRDYFEWAHAVVAGCRGINRQLDSGFDEVYRNGMVRLDRSGRRAE
jgi:(p)ppGpp synthase/HD superfamily hydrolase